MDLSETAKDESGGEAIPMSNDTPNAESKLTEAYPVEPTTAGEIRREAGGFGGFVEEIDR